MRNTFNDNEKFFIGRGKSKEFKRNLLGGGAKGNKVGINIQTRMVCIEK